MIRTEIAERILYFRQWAKDQWSIASIIEAMGNKGLCPSSFLSLCLMTGTWGKLTSHSLPQYRTKEGIQKEAKYETSLTEAAKEELTQWKEAHGDSFADFVDYWHLKESLKGSVYLSAIHEAT